MRYRQALLMIAAFSLICLSGVIVAQETNDNKQVRFFTKSVALVVVTPSAEKCGKKQKGTTTRFKVTGETPVDVRLYVQVGYKKWLNKDFLNQKPGDEITDYMCDRTPSYKVYARAAGSSDEWPKP